MGRLRDKIYEGMPKQEYEYQYVQEQEQEQKKEDKPARSWTDIAWVKSSGYIILALGIVYGSGFVFSALGFTVKSFKGMIKKFRE